MFQRLIILFLVCGSVGAEDISIADFSEINLPRTSLIEDQNGYCIDLSCDLMSDPIPKETNDTVFLKDCSCKASAAENNEDTEIQNLKKICECYEKQQNVQGLIRDVAAETRSRTINQAMVDESSKGIQEVINHFRLGAQAQVLYTSSNSPQDANLFGEYRLLLVTSDSQANDIMKQGSGLTANGTVSEKDSQKINRDAERDISQSVRKNLQSLALSGTNIIYPKIDVSNDSVFKANVVGESPKDLTAEQCISMKHFQQSQQVPVEKEFYESLRKETLSDAQDGWKNWSLPYLLSELETAINSQDSLSIPDANPRVRELKARIKFLYANPVYANVMAYRPDPTNRTDIEASNRIKSELFQSIKRNFTPTSCGKTDQVECAHKNSQARNAEDLAFFRRNEVSKMVQQEGPDFINDFLSTINERKGYFLDVPDVTTLGAELRAPVSSRTPAAIGASCADLRYMEKTSEKERLDTAEQYAGKFLRSLGKDFSFNKSENPAYQKMNKEFCQTKRCRSESNCNPDTAKTFSEYAEEKCQGKTGQEADRCLVDKRADYLNDYKYHKTRYGLSQIDADKNLYNFFRNVPRNKITDEARIAQTRLEGSPPPRGTFYANPSDTVTGKLSVDPVTGESIIRVAARARVTPLADKMSSAPISPSLKGAGSAVASRAREVIAPASAKIEASPVPDAAKISAIPNANSAAPSSPVLASYGFSPETGLTAPLRDSVTRDILAEKTQAADFESQANAAATQVFETQDTSERERLQAQIASLTSRADAADVRAKALEDQLREAERQAELAKVESKTASKKNSETLEKDAETKSQAQAEGPIRAPAAFTPQPSGPLPVSFAPTPNQVFGAGPGSVSIPATLPPKPGSVAKGKSTAVNFNFKYAADAQVKSADASGPAIIVAGSESSFNATSEFGAAVNEAKSLNLGNLSEEEAKGLSSRELGAVQKYAKLIRDAEIKTPGKLVRLVYSSEGSSREIIVAIDKKGTLFFPAVKNLAQARSRAVTLESMRSVINSTTGAN